MKKHNHNNIIDFILSLIYNINSDRIGVYAGQASFFMILSIFPIFMLLLNIIAHTSLIPNYIIPSIISQYMPDAVRSFLLETVDELKNSSNNTVLSVSALVAIWSASKGSLAIISGLRHILETKKTTNYFAVRFLSIIYTIILILAITIALGLLVFGDSIFKNLARTYQFLHSLRTLYSLSRYIVVMLLLTFFFLSIYKLGNDKHIKIIDILPGAMFSSLGWMVFSYLFSIYVENFSNFSYMYGSITAVIIIMLWLYICMYIMFIGAEINYVFTQNEQVQH